MVYCFLGLHLEGPFINECKKGAHRLEFVKGSVENGVKELEAMYGDLHNTSIITIAPELNGCMEAIEDLTRRGVTVSLGNQSSLAGAILELTFLSRIERFCTVMLLFYCRVFCPNR